MSQRRILRREGGSLSVAAESRFTSEEELHTAIASHPEVLPSEDVGLGPLVPLGSELDLGHGPIDLLCADGGGRPVIVEFKRGSENPDVRKVVAQVLDYGASLWRVDYDDLEQKCAVSAVLRRAPGRPRPRTPRTGRRDQLRRRRLPSRLRGRS